MIYENVAQHITRRAVKPKELHLPDNAQFIEFVQAIENAGGRSAVIARTWFGFWRMADFVWAKLATSPGLIATSFARKSLCVTIQKREPRTVKYGVCQ
jgi:hypothetical protein